MATSGSFNTGSVGSFYFTFEWSRTGYDSTKNEHYISYTLKAHNTAGKYRTVYAKKLVVNGTTVFEHAGTSGNGIPYYDGNEVISGNAIIKSSNDYGDGSFSASFEAGVGQYPSTNCSGSNSWNLDRIPRYAYFSKHWIHATTPNSVQVLYRPDRTISAAQYSLNGGAWTNLSVISGSWNSSGNDVIYQVGNLSPNTNYRIETRIQYAGGLWTYTGQVAFTTNDIARIKTASNFNIGDSPSITYSAAPNGSTLRAYLERIDKQGGTRIDDISASKTVTGTSCSFSYTASDLYSKVPNSNSGWCRFCLVTVCNGKEYWSSIDKQFFVTNSNPTFENFDYIDTNSKTTALTGNNQILVNKYSNIKATISTENKAVAKNSATMKSYKLTCGTKNISKDYSSTAGVELSLNNIDSSTITVYATDSRGNTTSKSKTATYKNYSELAITKLIATRQQNGVGSNVLLEFEGTYWSNSFGAVTNAISQCIYKYKLASSSEWTNGTTQLSYSASNGKFKGSILINGDLGTDGFNISNVYNIRLQMADKLVTKIVDITLPSGQPGLAMAKKGLAIKQKYNNDLGGALQVNGIIYALDPNNNTFIDIIKKIKEIESKL